MKSHLFSSTGTRERARFGTRSAVCRRLIVVWTLVNVLGLPPLLQDLKAQAPLSAADWVRQHFADLGAPPPITGNRTGRLNVITPILFDGATVTGGEKYGCDVCPTMPTKQEFGMVDSSVSGQHPRTNDQYGASIIASTNSNMTRTCLNPASTVGYLVNVTLNPGLPPWDPVGTYNTTNFDGVTWDAEGPSSALYTSGVTVLDWADAALDIDAKKSEHVRLTVQAPPDGPGYRALRFWTPGPHYLVDSTIADGSPFLIWVSAAARDNFELRVWKSSFAGQQTVPDGRAVWGDDNDPLPMERIKYLNLDPRATGEMHEMFAAHHGDFSSDSIVDAADYVVWRKNNGTQEAFNTWRANFGRTGGNGAISIATAPEPTTAILVVVGAFIGCWRTTATHLGRFKTR
jgi:hypothetical protein